MQATVRREACSLVVSCYEDFSCLCKAWRLHLVSYRRLFITYLSLSLSLSLCPGCRHAALRPGPQRLHGPNPPAAPSTAGANQAQKDWPYYHSSCRSFQRTGEDWEHPQCRCFCCKPALERVVCAHAVCVPRSRVFQQTCGERTGVHELRAVGV